LVIPHELIDLMFAAANLVVSARLSIRMDQGDCHRRIFLNMLMWIFFYKNLSRYQNLCENWTKVNDTSRENLFTVMLKYCR